MKTFYFSVILFLLAVGAVTVNYFYINNIADHLTELAESAPALGEEGCVEAAREIDDYWRREHNLVRLSVSFVELNLVSDAITSMKTFAEQDNPSEYENARELLINAIHEMRRLESLGVSSIL